jgi:polyphenol oxidase
MTPHAQSLPASMLSAGPTVLREVGALGLLTWPALDASGAQAAVTARSGGVSPGPYASLNLSLSVGDDPANVLENRRRLAAGFGARLADFVFAGQVHGAGVRVVGEADRGSGAFSLEDAIPATDALVTSAPGVVLAILTADCVPIVLHDPVAGVLACVHAGWRGTVARVCAAAVAAMQTLGSRPADVIAGIGPAIAPARYQVGPDVYQAVTQAFAPASVTQAFDLASVPQAAPVPFLQPDSAPGRWRLDLWSANRFILTEAGVPASQIHVTDIPTGPTEPSGPGIPTDPTGSLGPSDFFSDRTARPCGRLALIARLRTGGNQ